MTSIELTCEQRKLIEKIASENGFVRYQIDAVAGTAKGDNYLGVIKSVTIKGAERKLKLIVKSAHVGQLRNHIPIRQAYLREIFVYKQVFSKFDEFQKEFAIADRSQSHAKLYGSCDLDLSECLVLEDLRDTGFGLWNRKLPMDHDHLAAVIKEYAKFHAVSLAMKEKKPEDYNELTKHMEKHTFEEYIENEEKANRYIESVMGNVWGIFQEDSVTSALLKGLQNKLRDLMLNKQSEYTVIIHGDCWCNNLLFGYQDLSFNRTFVGFDYGPLGSPDARPTRAPESFMPTWVQLAWTSVFCLMIATATGGNCIVIWIVIAHRRMRTVTNYFLVNLSTADLLLTTFNCIFNFIYMIQRNWPFGDWYCTVSNFIANATVAASVFTLTGISCDRYLAIVYPLHPRMSKSSSLFSITCIWTASMLLALPCLLYSRTVTHGNHNQQRTGCILVWPDEKLYGSKYDLWYQMIFLVITYVVPIILMSICYTVMGTVLWGSRSIGEKTQRQIDAIRSKRKVVKMFISVVLIFGICWLPYHGYFIYVYFDTKVIFSRYTQHVYLGFYWFAMSNAMVNPLIYYWMNARFRKYFKTVICGWKNWFSSGESYETSPHGAHSHSFSKSGVNGTIRMRITSPRERDHRSRNGNSQIRRSPIQTATADANGEATYSSQNSRSKFWNKKQQTTDL